MVEENVEDLSKEEVKNEQDVQEIYSKENIKIQWKCSTCGYQFEGGVSPPDNCPGCKETCTLIDATCYTPECSMEGRDRRI